MFEGGIDHEVEPRLSPWSLLRYPDLPVSPAFYSLMAGRLRFNINHVALIEAILESVYPGQIAWARFPEDLF